MEILSNLKIRSFLLIVMAGFIIVFLLPLDSLFFVKYMNESVWYKVQSDICCYLIPLLVILFYLLKNEKHVTIFFQNKRFEIKDILLSDGGALLLGTGITCFLVFNLIYFNGFTEPVGNYFNSTDGVLYSFFEGVFLAPFCEEIIFRGYLLERMHKKWGTKKAIGISAFIFGILHLGGFVSSFIVGILFAIIRFKYQSLVPSMLAHMLNNIIVIGLKSFFLDQSANVNSASEKVSFNLYLGIMGISCVMILIGGILIWIFLKRNCKGAQHETYRISR
jgi:uncharacterized protein